MAGTMLIFAIVLEIAKGYNCVKIIKMTSDKPEIVKKIQEYVAKWKECGKYGHEPGSAECKERHIDRSW